MIRDDDEERRRREGAELVQTVYEETRTETDDLTEGGQARKGQPAPKLQLFWKNSNIVHNPDLFKKLFK